MMEKSFIATGNWQTFLTLNGEKLLMVLRRHPFVIIMPVIATILLTIIFLSFGIVVFQTFFKSLPMIVTSSLLLISISFAIIAKLIIDWYFHIYVLTNRKILEFQYTPLTSHLVNDIMLDRVFCTEVDYQTNGFMHDLLDLGDIIITFDRPTHAEDFILHDIQSCQTIGNFLTQQLMDISPKENITPIWFSSHSWGKR